MVEEAIYYPDQDVLLDAMNAIGAPHTKRLKGYFACGECGNQFIMNKNISVAKCPVCGTNMRLLTTVDEYAVSRVKKLCYGAGLFGVIEEEDNNYIYLCNALRNYYHSAKKEGKERSNIES